MGRDIHIGNDIEKNGGGTWLGCINPNEWESLFFVDFGIKTALDFESEGLDFETYEDYHSSEMFRWQQRFPLIVSTYEYYEDSIFPKESISELRRELEELLEIVSLDSSKRYLRQLHEATDVAVSQSAGMCIFAD